jgi:ABC-type transporter MlaC component
LNKSYYLLQQDGSLKDDPAYSQNKNQNYNAFSIDMIFTWNFAPGSELSCAWKTAALTDQSEYVDNYWINLHNSYLNQLNSFSVKVLYYIDFNSLKKKKYK